MQGKIISAIAVAVFCVLYLVVHPMAGHAARASANCRSRGFGNRPLKRRAVLSDYSFFGLASSAATRASKRPAAPPSRTR